jgi:hypothetical protein
MSRTLRGSKATVLRRFLHFPCIGLPLVVCLTVVAQPVAGPASGDQRGGLDEVLGVWQGFDSDGRFLTLATSLRSDGGVTAQVAVEPPDLDVVRSDRYVYPNIPPADGTVVFGALGGPVVPDVVWLGDNAVHLQWSEGRQALLARVESPVQGGTWRPLLPSSLGARIGRLSGLWEVTSGEGSTDSCRVDVVDPALGSLELRCDQVPDHVEGMEVIGGEGERLRVRLESRGTEDDLIVVSEDELLLLAGERELARFRRAQPPAE